MRRRAFTLVELLVVIGIIAVLISILIPALGRAKQQANLVKCQTQLREIGNCFRLYEGEYKGYWPVARLNGIRGPNNAGIRPYDVDGFKFINNSTGVGQGYYFNLLQKYATKSRMGNTAGTDRVNAQLSTRTIFYGCPSWQGYYKDGFTPVGDVNLVQPGFGMNIFPTFSERYPVSVDQPPQASKDRPREVAVMDAVEEFPTGNFLQGKTWSRSSERMLLADARFWLAQSGKVPAASTYPNCVTPQPLVINSGAFFGSASSTTVDIWRHGKYPMPKGTVFDTQGGKVQFNILYADGHVGSVTGDAKEAYRSIRMKFPG